MMFFGMHPGHNIALLTSLSSLMALVGRPKPPETVPHVDLERYAGRWFQIAGYPFEPSKNLVGITAEYTLRTDGQIEVINRGFLKTFEGPERTIEGLARITDPVTNAKLAVSFPSVSGKEFEGQYWIVMLDDAYRYAVVSDALRLTLFILSRTPTLDDLQYRRIIRSLSARGFDPQRIFSIAQEPAVK